MVLTLKERASSPLQAVKVHSQNTVSPRSEGGSGKSVPQKVFIEAEVT